MEHAELDLNTDESRGSAQTPGTAGCQAGDLRALLGTIVEQLNESDRRQADTMAQLQDRLTTMGRDATVMRPAVPQHLAPAFERIETGLSELAKRLSNSTAVPDDHVYPTAAAEAFSGADAGAAETAEAATAETAAGAFGDVPPSTHADDAHLAHDNTPDHSSADIATDKAEQADVLRGSGDYQERSKDTSTGIDPFDIIETSLPGDVSDPWDRDAAEALTGLYETGGANFTDKAAPQAFMSSPADSGSATNANVALDQQWIEKQFAAINARLDESLADFNPDQSFFALGQRLDGVEAQIAAAIETLSASTGTDSIHAVESHIGEIAGYLDSASQQLSRLDAIETHIENVAARLEEVYGMALEARDEDGGQALASFGAAEIENVARLAATEVSDRFVQLNATAQQGSNVDVADMRAMLESFIGERREGEASIAATLETLQSAVVGLLERAEQYDAPAATEAVRGRGDEAEPLDASAFTTEEELRSYEGPVTEYVAEMQQSGRRISRPAFADVDDDSQSEFAATDGFDDRTEATTASDDDLYSDASADTDIENAFDVEVTAEPKLQRTAAQMRQDFIADARRAKMRLASEDVDTGQQATAQSDFEADAKADAEGITDDESDVVIARRRRVRELPGSTNVDTSRTASRVKQVKSGGSAAPSPRLVVMGIGALLALGGLWYTLDGQPSAAVNPGDMSLAGKGGANVAPPSMAPTGAASGDGAETPAGSAGDESAPGAEPKGEFENGNPGSEIRGEIIPGNLVVGETTVPLPGLTVDSEAPMNVATLERASRRQSLANMSTRVGRAAANMITEVPIPTSLIPDSESGAAEASGRRVAAATANNPLSVSKNIDMPPATVGPLSLRLAAAQGDPSAEFQVGARFAEGKGLGQDFAEAGRWYQRAAARGFAQAQYRLGTLYERGLGMKADRARAEVWYKRAADNGNVKAMHNLAVMSTNSDTGSPDYMSAAQWFEKAADRGLSDSQFNLAVLYEHGLGVSKNLNTAYKWLLLAARGGDEEAVRRRDILKGKMTLNDIRSVETTVSRWRPRPTDALANDARVAGEAWKKTSEAGYNR